MKFRGCIYYDICHQLAGIHYPLSALQHCHRKNPVKRSQCKSCVQNRIHLGRPYRLEMASKLKTSRGIRKLAGHAWDFAINFGDALDLFPNAQRAQTFLLNFQHVEASPCTNFGVTSLPMPSPRTGSWEVRNHGFSSIFSSKVSKQ